MTATVLALVALAGCGGSGGSSGSSSTASGGSSPTALPHRYPKAAEDGFMSSCTAQPKATKPYCACTLARIEEKVPYAEFKQADQAIRSFKSAAPHARAAITSAIQACKSQL